MEGLQLKQTLGTKTTHAVQSLIYVVLMEEIKKKAHANRETLEVPG